MRLKTGLPCCVLLLLIITALQACTTPVSDPSPIPSPLASPVVTVKPEASASPAPSSSPSPVPTPARVDAQILPGVLDPEVREPLPTPGSISIQDLVPESLPTSQPEEKKPIVVSTEVFTQTFSEVETLIFLLNQIIKDKNYSLWTKYLDTAYIQMMSDPATLEEKNKSPTLRKLGVNLKTLEDYFRYVVVPSRANSRLDDLVFLSETEVEAIMIIGNRRVTVYRLIKIDGQWKIGLS